MKKNQILVTNDDGIFSPGLRAAVEAVMDLGEVVVAAPRGQQTGMGRSLQFSPDAALEPTPFEVDGAPVRAFFCECSPAMAVRHCMRTLFPDNKPDLVVSGINYGENLGVNIGVSGTVGAALEGASHGAAALAVSKPTDIDPHRAYSEQDWSVSVHFLKYFSRILLAGKAPFDVDVLKIDVPDSASEQTPWRLTRQAMVSYYTSVMPNPSLKSKVSDARLTLNATQSSLDPESDIHAFARRREVSVTPLSLDMTSRTDFEEMHRFLDGGRGRKGR